ncbi:MULTISPECIES: heme exporter protein CcmD [Cupriavidus]|uniref:Heme exporter protein D n=1 Tax=Cupriavidus pinatubonensis TaxID=248026 RepID=A0ABM8WBR9_9BURK|nr:MULTISPECIES: heme exporter protein CcmD [Cupriavidus]QYY28201.1 heme exporter protein CcmD [Cupriavidus pinatubonensis]TPQ44337.1 heme exporter protein CcmD [Cupriavidus pinatubonensis]CAG9164710.1 hypothetical protein LMG23994_00544 [Cupriavidus pinatubonensis]
MSEFTLSSLTGHAGYIAGAFGVAFALIGVELVLLARRSRASATRHTPR